MKKFNYYFMLLLLMFVCEIMQAQDVKDTLKFKGRQSELITPNHKDIYPILDTFIAFTDSLFIKYDTEFIYQFHFTERNNDVYISCTQKCDKDISYMLLKVGPRYYFEYKGILFTLDSRFPENVFVRTKNKKYLNLNLKKNTNLLYCIKDSNKYLSDISFHYKYIDDKFIFVDKLYCDGNIVEESIRE